MTSQPRSFSDLDAFFYIAETPSQHLHVLATLVVDRSTVPDGNAYEMFQTRIRDRYLLVDPLRRSPTRSYLGQRLWVDETDIHLQRHLHHVLVAEGTGLDGLADVAGRIASYPLPRDRPLWEAWLVEGFDENLFAVIAKVHHSAVDGISGIFALAAFFDLEPLPPPPSNAGADLPESPSTARIVATTFDALRQRPGAVIHGLRRLSTSAVQLISSRSETAPLPCTGPRMPYNRALTPRRSVAFTTLKLEDVKRVTRERGGSVNDVIMALCAGVLHRHALKHGHVPARPIVAAVPVSERKPQHGAAGNQLSFMFYALPVHVASTKQRLDFVIRSSTDTKEVYLKAGQGLLGASAAVFPKFAVGPAVRAMSSIGAANVLPPFVNVLISNIKGPEFPLYVAGAKLSSIFPMGPVLEGVGLGITAVSFVDELSFGFMACPDLVDDVGEMARELDAEMAALSECL